MHSGEIIGGKIDLWHTYFYRQKIVAPHWKKSCLQRDRGAVNLTSRCVWRRLNRCIWRSCVDEKPLQPASHSWMLLDCKSHSNSFVSFVNSFLLPYMIPTLTFTCDTNVSPICHSQFDINRGGRNIHPEKLLTKR